MEKERPRAGLEEYAEVIARRDEGGSPFVIVGGQAVNYWAEVYAAREPQVEVFRPFTSKDLDLLATTDQTRELAASLAGDGWAFDPPEEGADVVQGSLRRGDLLVELMRPVYRPTSEPLDVLFHVGSEPVPLRVSHPLELLRSKMDLAVFIPQDGSIPEIAPRRDVAHVQMLALIMPHHLADLAAQYSSPSECAAAVQGEIGALSSMVRHGPARRFEDRYPGLLNWSAMVPDQVKELPFSDLYRRCVNALSGSIPPAARNP